MENQQIDYADSPFWLIFFVALLVLVPLVNARARQWAWAAINLAFLGLLLTWPRFAMVFGAVLGVYLLLKGIQAGRGPRFLALVLGSATLGLFLLYKRPDLSAALDLRACNPILAVVSFSYVALRLVEMLRSVFEGRHPAPDFPSTINYLLPFHMLAAGPIQGYDDFVTQPTIAPRLGPWDVLGATERIAGGLVKKFVLAYALQKLFLTGFHTHGLYFFFEVQIFYIWLYLDFSALSDIAVGIGRLLGVATPENFDRPYLARNMINFWERWHISLSQFIRRNVYIPLQLSLVRRTSGRHPLLCSSIAFTVAFGLCGLWHGIYWVFLLWGLWHAFGLIVTNIYRHYLAQWLGNKGVKKYLGDWKIRVASTVVTFEFVAFSLVIIAYPWQEIWQ